MCNLPPRLIDKQIALFLSVQKGSRLYTARLGVLATTATARRPVTDLRIWGSGVRISSGAPLSEQYQALVMQAKLMPEVA
jgi:hypothetical protein